jgi:hypothetical protein
MWKSQNFPANYNSDQATPALHDESASSANPRWWDEHELGTAIVEAGVPLHPDLLNDYVEHNSFDDGDDEYVSDYIDLILLAIITQVERYKTYSLNPTTALMDEIRAHEECITNAESSLNVHIVRIMRLTCLALLLDWRSLLLLKAHASRLMLMTSHNPILPRE